MSRLIQFILIAVSLMILAPAQASLNFDTGLNTCQVFAADDSDGGKKKDSDKKDGDKKEGEGEGEEEEPDCD